MLKGGLALEALEELPPWSIESTHVALALLDLNQLSEVPGEFLRHIVVVGYVLDINKVVVEDSCKYVTIIAIGIASDVEIVVSSMVNVCSRLIPVHDLVSLKKVLVVDNLRLSIKGLDDHLLAIRLQEHVCDEASSHEERIVLLKQSVVHE